MSATQLARLVTAVERHAPVDGDYETDITRLAFYRSSTQTEHSAVTYVPSLCVIVQGAKEIIVGGEQYRYDPAQSLLVSVDLPAASRIVQASPDQPCLALRIEIDSADVGELLAEGTSVPPGTSERGLAVIPVESQLLDAVTRLVNLLDTPQDIRALAPLILREITHRLLTGPQGFRLRQIAMAGAPAFRIARAIRWLKDHFADPLKVESLADQVGMSTSSFHLHFKNVTTMTPLQYQKRIRLQEARNLMIGERLDAADAAFRVGYESPSQFSREYRRMFGAPPRQNISAITADQA
jgi:AraC-like DNA-binding protein